MFEDFYGPDHQQWRDVVRTFVAKEVAPHQHQWEDDGAIPHGLWTAAAQQGLLALTLPARFGGGGEADYRYRVVIMEELAAVGAASVNAGFSQVDDLFGPYLLDLGTAEQHERWLPGLCAGELTSALALTEPGAGSDLRAARTTAVPVDGGWLLNGAKTFITNGGRADLLVVFARTPDAEHGDFSLFVLEKGMAGFSAGRPIQTMGRKAEGVTELFFDDVHLPAGNLLGRAGGGFGHLMERLPRERLSIASYALAASHSALAWTLEHTRGRHAFGRPLAALQTVKFTLAELDTEIDVARAYVQAAVLALNAGTLSAVEAAKAKWWTTELLQRVLSRCVQLHGGYGYSLEYPIARAFLDARIQTIYGGTTEIMKEVIGRALTTDAVTSRNSGRT